MNYKWFIVTIYLASLACVARGARVAAVAHYASATCAGAPLYMLPGGSCEDAPAQAPQTCLATTDPGLYQQTTCVDLAAAPPASSVLVPATFAASGPTLAFVLTSKCEVRKMRERHGLQKPDVQIVWDFVVACGLCGSRR